MNEQNISMQQLKEQRLTPAEKFVLDTIKGAKARGTDEYGDVMWYKDSKWLFTQYFSVGVLYVNDVFFDISKRGCSYGLNDGEIIQLLTRLLHKYTNNGQLKI
jgi:hypothetical protein